MHRDGDDDTIWSFAPEACDNITATCYVLHGRRHAWELLTPTQENATTDTSGKLVPSAHVSKQKDGVGGLVGDARIGEVKEKDGGVSQSVADRRVLGRSIFCIWICRICQISQTMSLLPSFLFQTASNARGYIFLPPESLCLSFLRLGAYTGHS